MVVHVVIVEVVPRTHGLAGLLGVKALVHTKPLGHGFLLLAILLAEQTTKTALLRVLTGPLSNGRLAHLYLISGVGGLAVDGSLARGIIEADRRGGAHGLGAGVSETLGHLRTRRELLRRRLGSERVNVSLQRVGQVKEGGTAGDVAGGRMLLGGIAATAPLGILDGTRTRTLGAIGLGSLFVALFRHRGKTRVVVLHNRALVGAFAILKLGEGGRVSTEGDLNALSRRNRGHGTRRRRIVRLSDGLHGSRGSKLGLVSRCSGGLVGSFDLLGSGSGVRPGIGLGRLGLELNRLRSRGLIGLHALVQRLRLRLGNLNEPHLRSDVGDVAAWRENAKLADDGLTMTRANDLLDDLTHNRLAARGTNHGIVHGFGGGLLLVLGRTNGLVASGAHALHNTEHGSKGGLVVHAAGGIGQELSGNQRDAPGKDRQARNNAENPEGAASTLRKKNEDLNEGANANRTNEVGCSLCDVLLCNCDLRTRKEVETLSVIVGQNHDGTVVRGILALGRMECNDVLAVGARTSLGDEVVTQVGCTEEAGCQHNEQEPDERHHSRANAHKHNAQEQDGHEHAVGKIAQRRGRKVLNLRLKPMGRKHFRQRLGAVKLLLATSRGNTNLGIEILEEFLRNAHPVTFRIAARPLPAIV